MTNVFSHRQISVIIVVVLFLSACTAVSQSVTPTVVPQTPTPTVMPTPTASSANSVETEPLTSGEPGMISYQTMTMADGTELTYAVALPNDFDQTQTYPILLALPPGPQTRDMVNWGLNNYWANQAREKGWIVLSPVAPNNKLFFQGSESLIPEFLDRTAKLYQPENGKYHLGGISNGGISSFRIAIGQPERFHSLIAAPGFPRSEDREKISVLKDIPVVMFVGEGDVSWVEQMEMAQFLLEQAGGQVSLDIVEDEGHVIESLAGGQQLFELLESFR